MFNYAFPPSFYTSGSGSTDPNESRSDRIRIHTTAKYTARRKNNNSYEISRPRAIECLLRLDLLKILFYKIEENRRALMYIQKTNNNVACRIRQRIIWVKDHWKNIHYSFTIYLERVFFCVVILPIYYR